MSESTYLNRYAWKEKLFPEYQPHPDLEFIVVIPSYREEGLISSLDSLNKCLAPEGKVLIIVLVNEPDACDAEVSTINRKSIDALSEFKMHFDLLVSHITLPNKKAGVGLARKIGMDQAVRIFEQLGKDGVIACYDADCSCHETYLKEIEAAFSKPSANAGVVFHEHPLDGDNSEEITDYELFLRYYIDCLRWSGFPYAHQTLGSCIVVRSSIYQKQGGMSTKKAGEDFYFLNKVIPLGGFVEINDTTIYPSDRVSERVPFGTGRAIGQMISSSSNYSVYNPETFKNLKAFFGLLHSFWLEEKIKVPICMEDFLANKAGEHIKHIKSQSSNFDRFRDKFFHWFDAFKILKFVHFCRDHYFPNIPLMEALLWLNDQSNGRIEGDSKIEMLNSLRSIDRSFKEGQKGF